MTPINHGLGFRVDIPFPDAGLSSSLIGGTCTSRRSTFSKSRPRKKTWVPRMWRTPNDLGTFGAAKILVFHRISSTDMGFCQFLRIELTSNQMVIFHHKRNTKRNCQKIGLSFALLSSLVPWLPVDDNPQNIGQKLIPYASICQISQPTAVLNNQLTLKNIPLLVPSARHVFGALGQIWPPTEALGQLQRVAHIRGPIFPQPFPGRSERMSEFQSFGICWSPCWWISKFPA